MQPTQMTNFFITLRDVKQILFQGSLALYLPILYLIGIFLIKSHSVLPDSLIYHFMT